MNLRIASPRESGAVAPGKLGKVPKPVGNFYEASKIGSQFILFLFEIQMHEIL